MRIEIEIPEMNLQRRLLSSTDWSDENLNRIADELVQRFVLDQAAEKITQRIRETYVSAQEDNLERP